MVTRAADLHPVGWPNERAIKRLPRIGHTCELSEFSFQPGEKGLAERLKRDKADATNAQLSSQYLRG